MSASLKTVYNILLNRYGEQGWWPVGGEYNPAFKKRNRTEKEKFEIAVGAILTQSTSWKNVEKALEEMRDENILDLDKIIKIDQKRLAKVIKSAGYHNQKAKKLKHFCKFLKNKRKKKPTREELLSVWGIGPETADSMLLYAYSKPIFVIDAYTKRIISRIDGKGPQQYHELQEIFHSQLEKDPKIFNEYHALLVEHAKIHCKTKPKCENCPLSKKCKGRLTK